MDVTSSMSKNVHFAALLPGNLALITGSASDSRSEGCVFESRRGQLSFFAFILITISIEKNVKAILKSVEIMKQLVK